VTHLQIQWLGAVPWETVRALNQALCQAKQLPSKYTPQAWEPARRLWEEALPRKMGLTEVLDVCRRAHEQAPFAFENGNTFAAIARTLVEELLKVMPPLEAQIIRTTVCHYVVGLVGQTELLGVLKHFDAALKKFGTMPRPASLVPPPPRASL